MILLASNDSSVIGHVVLLGLLLLVIMLALGAMLIAGRLDNFLGASGEAVLTRLLGVLLAALSVQFVVDGVKSAWAA